MRAHNRSLMELPPSVFDNLPLEVEQLILDFALSLIRDERARQAYRACQLGAHNPGIVIKEFVLNISWLEKLKKLKP